MHLDAIASTVIFLSGTDPDFRRALTLVRTYWSGRKCRQQTLYFSSLSKLIRHSDAAKSVRPHASNHSCCCLIGTVWYVDTSLRQSTHELVGHLSTIHFKCFFDIFDILRTRQSSHQIAVNVPRDRDTHAPKPDLLRLPDRSCSNVNKPNEIGRQGSTRRCNFVFFYI